MKNNNNYDCYLKLLQNKISNNSKLIPSTELIDLINIYFVSLAMSRILIENLLLIKLIVYGDEELIKTYVYLRHYKGIVDYGKNLGQTMSKGQQKFVEDFDNYYLQLKNKYGRQIDGKYGWAISEIIKEKSWKKGDRIDLFSITKCLQLYYNDNEARDLYDSFDRLSSFNHASSSKKMANSSFMIPESYVEKTKISICKDTLHVVKIMISELNKVIK